MTALVFLFALGMAVFAWSQTRQGGTFDRRVRKLEEQVRLLNAAIAALHQAPTSSKPHTDREEVAPVPTVAPVEPTRATSVSALETPEPTPSSPPVQPPLPPSPPKEPGPRRVPSPPKVAIDWERWVGVRGAAVLGGIVLALAGIYFFQYSIEHGLVPPWLRVVSGTLVGLACVVAAEWKIRERYENTANGLIGGGVVVLYAAFWSAHSLYGLVGFVPAFILMIAVTAACAGLAYRHASLVIAMLGLVGGFLTPLLIASTESRPVSLFAYILVLDGCLLFMARRRGWPLLALLSLVGTLLYQAMWIIGKMEPGELLLGLLILCVFALLYAVAARDLPKEDRKQWLITQGGGTLFPFLFAIYFASRVDLGEHYAPLALLLAVLSAAACWLGQKQTRAWMGLGAASGTVTVAAVWVMAHSFTTPIAWEVVGFSFLLALIYHIFVEIDPESSGWDGPAPAAILCALSFQGVLLVASQKLGSTVSLWPWLVGQMGHACLLLRHGSFQKREPVQLGAALLLGLAVAFYQLTYGGEAFAPSTLTYCAIALFVGGLGQVLAMGRKAGEARLWGERAAALIALLFIIPLVDVPRGGSFAPFLFTIAALGFFAAQSAARISSGRWFFASTTVAVFAQSCWTFNEITSESMNSVVLGAMAIQLLSLLLFSFWPFAVMERFKADRWAWWAAALAGPAWFPSLKHCYEAGFGDAAIGLLPVMLGGISLVAARRTMQTCSVTDPIRKSNIVWFLAVALGFLTAAIPLQLEKEWVTIGWALEALAVSILWKRFDHPGLKYLALALVLGVGVRLILNDAILGYHPRPSWRIINWLLYTYLVPAAAILKASTLFQGQELVRLRAAERRQYPVEQPLVAIVCGLVGVAVIFAWINLAIADWFSTGEWIHVYLERLPARDLTISIAWAIYAMLLLAVGVQRESRGLRWLSLGLMMVTAIKVFLYDLGKLEDLYRVGSLAGLAVSLILISIAFQRFVVERPPKEME